ncbi:MAG: TetR family transcriptional regulator [Herbaspirillum sp.]|jgi:AcrR family transcriptional regulator|nr:TetR family transcriptional regulator [Herbaspirillum sp.]
MAAREGLRPGGRSARVQESVHQAVNALLAEMPRDEITVAQAAARAGVTPSTIYRRWGDLQTLLADVAVKRFHPDTGPADTGSLQNDLEAWAQGYQEEMSSAPGRAMTRDVLAGMNADGSGPARQCAAITRSQLQMILNRAIERGESPLDVHDVMDSVVAPLMYRLLFDDVPIDPAFARTRMAMLLAAQTEA